MAKPIVDLPEPLSPTSPTVSPSCTVIDDVIDRLHVRDRAPQHARLIGKCTRTASACINTGDPSAHRRRRAARLGGEQLRRCRDGWAG